MNRDKMEAILEKIKEYDRIMIFRHLRNDGDCVGASKGLKRLIQLTWPEKEVYLIDHDTAQYLEFMGPEDEEVPDDIYQSALGIVVDTASEARISNPKYKLCKELIKIDHHIPLENYGNLAWVEEERSSCCEMIVVFYDTFRDQLKIDSEAATYLYTGMVTDSGRFKYDGVTGDTLRMAAILLDVGVDTDTLFARLYLEAYEYLKFKAVIYERMQITPNGVAYIYIDRAMQE
ncbi:MAG: bifunctional oligoribonuclease/PAP phosphatase NrnA, partial [Oscillospiraceae bacterium]|nr:bifunctional oligoribonuclease/PAP phosphatase NrnA [Oscillospiraceae bacterium]